MSQFFALSFCFVARILLVMYLALTINAQSDKARSLVIRGRVLDARTGEALEKIRIEQSSSRAISFSNRSGEFVMEIDPNETRLLVSAAGYALLKYDLPLAVLNGTDVEIALQPEADTVRASVTVTGEIFEGLQGKSAPSEHTLNKSELLALGTAVIGDPLRSAQALPSVTSANDGRGEISVRGSAFERVGVIVDGILLDGFLHQISDGGTNDRDRQSFSMVTPDRIAEMSLLNGAFPASHGMRTAGILEMKTRDGNRERRDFRISTGLQLGTTLVHDGPFARKRGTYLIGVRSSALNPVVGGGDRDSSFRFDDAQWKVTYALGSRHQLGFSGIVGRFNFKDSNSPTTLGRNALGRGESSSAAIFVNWGFTIASNVFVSTRLYHTQANLSILNREQVILGRTPRRQWGGRQDWMIQTRRGGQVQFGTYIRALHADGENFVFVGAMQQNRRAVETFRGSSAEGNYYVQASQTIAPSMTLSGGARVESNSLTRERLFSPRVALTWNPSDGRFILRLGYGQHRQFPDIAEVTRPFGNRLLRSERTDHFTGGGEFRVSERSRLRFEVFERRDRDQVFALEGPLLRNGIIVEPATRPANSLFGRARGMEVMWQRRSGNRLSGWLSYAYLRTRMNDRASNLSFPMNFDQRHTFNLFGNYRISPTWSTSVLYRAASGQPLAAFLRRDSRGQLFIASQPNELRLRSYGRLDLRLNKSISWKAARLTLTGELLNLLNQGNQNFGAVERVNAVTGQVLNPVTDYGFSRTFAWGMVLQF